MAFKKQQESSFITILLKIALIVVPAIATTNIDCKGKAFHCVNSTHFKICVDFGGVSKTVDDFFIPCPPSTACTDNNYYECEYQIPTTSAALDIQSDVTNEHSESSLSSPLELFDVTTFFPLINNEKSVELTESSTIPQPVIVSEAAGKETADIHNYSLMNDVQNKVITENILHKTTVSDLSESDINDSMYNDVIPSTIRMAAMNGILDYLNTTMPYSAIDVDNYSTTERAISGDFKTTALNNVEKPGFIANKLFSPVMTDILSTNEISEKVTTEKYISIKSKIAIDLYEPVTTTLTNNIENEDFLSLTTDNLGTNRTTEKATTEEYTSTKTEIAVDSYEPVITKLTNNLENEDLPSTITDNLSTNITTEEYTSTTSDKAIDLYEPEVTTVTNMKENEDLPSTITDNLSTNRTTEKATTEEYTSTTREIGIDSYGPVITTLTNNLENEDIPLTDKISTDRTTEKRTTEEYTSTKSEIAFDLYEPAITTFTNLIENENLPSTISVNLSTNTTVETATTEEYTSTTSEIAIDLYESEVTTVTNMKENEDLPSTITGNVSTNRTTEKATTEEYTSTTSEIAIDSYGPVITTLTNNLENEDIPLTDNLSTNRTTEEYTSTKSEIAFDLYEPAITILTNLIENENLPSTISVNLSTNTTVETATTEEYTSTTSEIAIDLYEPEVTTVTNIKENEDLPSTITDNVSTNRTTEKATTEEYTSTTSEIAIDSYGPVIATLTNNLENEDIPSTDNLSTNRTTEKRTTEEYTSTKSEIAFDLYEPAITTLTNLIENENLPSTISVNLSTNTTAETATTEKYISTKSNIAIDLYEPVTITLTNNIESEDLPSIITDNLSTNTTAETAITEKYTSTNSEIAVNLYEPVITTLTNNIENEDLPSTITDNLSKNRTTEKVTSEEYTSTTSEIAIDSYEPVITTHTNNIENENLPSTITDNLSTSETAEKATTEKYTSTNSETAINLYESVITTFTNNIENENPPSTKTDNLSTNRIAETVTTEKYTSTNSEIAIDNDPVIATLMNIIEKEDFHSTTLSSAIAENINTNISSAAVSTPNHSGINSEILITTSNYLGNPYFTTTLYSSVIKEKVTNHENSEINSTDTSGAYLVSPQDTTAKDVNFPTETATHAYIFYTNTVKKSSSERADDYSMHVNGTHIKNIDEISSYSKIEDSIQTSIQESPMITENIALNNTLEGYSIEEQKDFSSVTRADSLNFENIFTTDTTNSTKNTAENKQQDMTVKDFNRPTLQASILHKNYSNDKENIHPDIDYTYTTVHSPIITESNSNAENLINSSPDAITFTTRSDLVNVQQDTAKKNVNCSTAINDIYRNAAMNSSQVDNTSMHETPTSNADLLFTPGYDKKLQLRSAVNVTLKDTIEEISAKEQNDVYLQISKDHSFSENKNEILAAISVIDSTNSYERNLATASTVNEIEIHTNITKKTSNDTAQHKKDVNKNEINDITSPLPPNADFIITSFLKTNSDEISLTTVNVDLNDQVEEYLIKENNQLPSSVNSESSLVTEIIMKNSSLLSDLIVTTESYNANLQQNMTVINLHLSTSSLTNETIGYQPNNQNSKVIETLTHNFTATTDEYGSKENLMKQRYDYDDDSTSIYTSFAKPEYNVKLKDPFINMTTKQTTKIDTDLSKIQVKSYDSIYSTIDSKETLINNTVKEISRNDSDNNTNSSQKNAEYSLNLFNSTNTEYGLAISKNSSKIAKILENWDNATVSKNISTPLILSANNYKEIKTTNDESTQNSVKSGGLSIHDSSDNLLPLSNQHLQNTLISSNESTPLHAKMNIDLNQDLRNFTMQNINNRFISRVNTDKQFYNQNVSLQALKISTEMLSFNSTQLNNTFENRTTNSASNTYVPHMPKNKTSFNNISENLENLSRNYQNNSNYKMISNKTKKDVIEINARSINKNKQINITANQDNRKEQNNRNTKITAKIQLNNNSSKDYERTIVKFDCKNRRRGKYSDRYHCQTFYICIGRSEPILGKCPKNTVFSEITKQCTKNLSHCIRNNQFQCTAAGRYIDIFSDQFYFICAKNVEGYIRFKLKCQRGYHLDKSKLQCILDSLNESNEDISETDREKSTIESKSKEERDSKNPKNNFECKKEGKFVYPDDCRKYYQCTKIGKSEFRCEIKKCDSDEIFHNEKRKCVGNDSYDSNE